jgi:hypothetical protein
MDNFEAREQIVERLAEVLYNLTDPDDMKGEEEIAMDEYRAFSAIMAGSLDLRVVNVNEDGTFQVTMKLLDLQEYVEKILSE